MSDLGELPNGETVVLREEAKLIIIDKIYSQPDTGRYLYKILNNNDNIYYALKVFDLSINPSADIYREMLSMNKLLQRPELFPRCRHYTEQNGWGLLRMDWLDGKSLREIYTTNSSLGPETVKLRLNTLIALCYSVQIVHESRLLHRDIKPDNALLRNPKNPNAGVMLIDFGLCAVKRQTAKIGEGTLEFRAPEQAGKRSFNLNQATDIYSVGQVGWWLLTGHPRTVYANDDSTDWDDEGMPKLVNECPQAPKALDDILAKAMAYNPKHRYGSIAQMASAIKQCLRNW
jgi:serine/threonine-protein kinase